MRDTKNQMRARTIKEFEELLRLSRTSLVKVVVRTPDVVYCMIFGMN